MTVSTEDPLFPSAHSALVFALNFCGQSHARPLMNRIAAPTIGPSKGLAGLDGAAQSGMIRAELHALGSLSEAILIARLAPRSKPCSCRSPCCSGHRPNQEWTDAIGYLADRARTAVYVGCVVNGIMRRDYLVRYFTRVGDRISLEDLAEKHGINRNTASSHNAKISTWLGGVQGGKNRSDNIGMERAAFDAIDERLRSIGMIG